MAVCLSKRSAFSTIGNFPSKIISKTKYISQPNSSCRKCRCSSRQRWLSLFQEGAGQRVCPFFWWCWPGAAERQLESRLCPQLAEPHGVQDTGSSGYSLSGNSLWGWNEMVVCPNAWSKIIIIPHYPLAAILKWNQPRDKIWWCTK